MPPPSKKKWIQLSSPEAHFKSVNDRLKRLRDEEKFADLCFVCHKDNGRVEFVRAHRFLFTSKSSLFRELYQISIEKQSYEPMVISLNSMDPEVVRALVDYMYSGETGPIKSGVKAGISELIEILQIDIPLDHIESCNYEEKLRDEAKQRKSSIEVSRVEDTNEGQKYLSPTKKNQANKKVFKNPMFNNVSSGDDNCDERERKKPAKRIGPKSMMQKVRTTGVKRPRKEICEEGNDDDDDDDENDKEEEREGKKSAKRSKLSANSSKNGNSSSAKPGPKSKKKGNDLFVIEEVSYCPVCNAIYLSPNSLKDHIKKNHPNLSNNSNDESKEKNSVEKDDDDSEGEVASSKKKTVQKIRIERKNAKNSKIDSESDCEDSDTISNSRKKSPEKIRKERKSANLSLSDSDKSSVAEFKRHSSSSSLSSDDDDQNEKIKSKKKVVDSSKVDDVSKIKTGPSSAKKSRPGPASAKNVKFQDTKNSKYSDSSKPDILKESSTFMDTLTTISDKKADKKSKKDDKKPKKTEKHDSKRESVSSGLHGCKFCTESFEKAANLKNHVLNHFKDKILVDLPTSKPFVCPICQSVSRDKITLLRHYSFSHRKIYDHCSEEDLQGISSTNSSTTHSSSSSKNNKKGNLKISSSLFKSKPMIYTSSSDDDDDDNNDKKGQKEEISSENKEEEPSQQVPSNVKENEEVAKTLVDPVKFTDSESENDDLKRAPQKLKSFDELFGDDNVNAKESEKGSSVDGSEENKESQ